MSDTPMDQETLEGLGTAARSGNLRVLLGMVRPMVRGLVMRVGRRPHTVVPSRGDARFDWTDGGNPDGALGKLYAAAKRGQWDGDELPWDTEVDPDDPRVELFPEELLPLPDIPAYRKLPAKEKRRHRTALLAWMLSQFLHGEQGALYAACQVTQAVPGRDGTLYGSTQVVDEGRHVEVFHRYLTEKLEKLYLVDDNLFVVLDTLMGDRRWDMKFLGMQIMVEGLALGAFCVMRQSTQEPLLKELLKRVITDEARHVHYGVVALADHIAALSEGERREREDWAYEVAVLLRNRFLAGEFYEEYYGHCMSRREWDRLILSSRYMERFRRMMFRRLVPNLRRIHLLSDRVRPHYASLGILRFENEASADRVSAEDLLAA